MEVLLLVTVGVLVLTAILVAGGVTMASTRRRGSRRRSNVHQAAPVTDEAPAVYALRCPVCGADVPPGSPHGLCPRCLLHVAVVPSQASAESPPTATYAPGLTPPSTQDLAGHFPQLEIVELLGKGGMGVVYKARQPHLDRFVALKILPPETGRDPAFAERFAREARALGRLNHPHIVAVYDYGQSGEFYYVVMEYVEGVNLRQAMRAGQLTPEEALRIVPQLCDALQFAHDEGIVHRDIKPENILLDKRGRVKVADFGLAKLLGQSAADTGLTGTQQVMGTLHYMAPEQLAGARAVDHRADIYSLGVTFYEMLTGELPLGRFPPPSKRAAIDVRLDDVVLRTLEREPADRYQHASDVKTDVESIAREPALQTSPSIGIATRPRGLPFWTTPAYRRWVGIPSLILIGLYALIMAYLFLLFLADGMRGGLDWWFREVRVFAIGCPAIMIAAFVFLNLVWAFYGRYQSNLRDLAGVRSEIKTARRSQPYKVFAWTAVCAAIYLFFWLPGRDLDLMDAPLGCLDGLFWPYRGRLQNTISLDPTAQVGGQPASYRRLVITETVEASYLGWSKASYVSATFPRQWDGKIPREERSRHEFVVHVDRIDGDQEQLIIDALDGMSWRYRHWLTRKEVRGPALDLPTALAWMRDSIGVKVDEKGQLRRQTNFWLELVRSAAKEEKKPDPPKENPPRDDRPVGKLDRLAREQKEWGVPEGPFPFRDWVSTETASFGPVISITSVGAPLMIGFWVLGLWSLSRTRAQPATGADGSPSRR
jgi:predicted Ser/Thr protein kinase